MRRVNCRGSWITAKGVAEKTSLAGERFEEEEIASEAHDKVSVDNQSNKKWETKT